jgi:thiol-disulfide isomerase/thioredoxin
MSVVTLPSTRAPLLAIVLLGLLGCTASTGLGCGRAEPEPRPSADPAVSTTVTPSPRPATSAPAAAASTPAVGAPAGPLILARGVRSVHAGAGSDAAQVVHVGAKWCEPCQSFHKAAAKGDLDGEFPDLTLLEFDLDEDRDRLATAGYVSQYIPLFAMPGSDGRASEKKFEGSVKGDGAVANIAPRLRSLLRK